MTIQGSFNVRRCTLAILLLLPGLQALAQSMSSVRTRWSDSFVEWEIYRFVPRDSSDVSPEQEEATEAADEEVDGELKQRWRNVKDDWSEWDYEIGDEQGTIRVKWKDEPSQWELRSYDGNIITMRTSWPKDYTEWRVTDNSVTLTLKSKWKNQLDEWLVDDPTRGRFYMYTLRSRDPRDWAIEDRLDESVSAAMKTALIFLTVFNGSPRF